MAIKDGIKRKFFGTWGRSQNSLWIQLGNQSYTLASLSIVLIILGVCRAISSGHLSARQALKRSSPHKVRGCAWIQSNTSMSVLLLILLSFASLFFCMLWQWNLQCNLTHPIIAGVLPRPCFPKILARTTFVLESLLSVKQTHDYRNFLRN